MLFFLQNPDAPASTPECFTPFAGAPTFRWWGPTQNPGQVALPRNSDPGRVWWSRADIAFDPC